MAAVTLPLPLLIGLMLLILGIGAALVFFVVKPSSAPTEATVTATATAATPTIPLATPTITSSPLPEATWTPVPPIKITVQPGEFCANIAAQYQISLAVLMQQNALGADCALKPGQELIIPMPTLTPSPMPSQTVNASKATEISCEFAKVTVDENMTLYSLSLSYNVPMEAIQKYNNLSGTNVMYGMPLNIPLCERNATPGPTPTPTNPPPYQGPDLLLPADGTIFANGNDAISLQWAAVALHGTNEAYKVTVEDVTAGTGQQLVDYVTDTKFIVPVSFRPVDTVPHIIRWTVQVVRQSGSTKDGEPIYVPAGAVSYSRAFGWAGGPQAPTEAPTLTPTP
ncbi:MAG TPA: LysM peptidoglycan-binding domain-containing protein [Bellilinea sp.]|nr:LysM peptidoglycan-binding domain-containing protein [Bellilinea sp.]